MISPKQSGNEMCVQSESQRLYVQQLYPAERLFKVKHDFLGAQMMDIPLTQGTIVGVIKEEDPMGNKDKWFIDNGGKAFGQISLEILKL